MTTDAKLRRDVQALLDLLASGVRGDCVPGSSKGEFRRLSRRVLLAVAAGLGLSPGSYDLRFNAGGPAVSGEATLHAETLYVQISDTPLGILYRSCEGRKDYRGGANRWLPLRDLLDFDRSLRSFAEAAATRRV